MTISTSAERAAKRDEIRAIIEPDGLLGGLVWPSVAEEVATDDDSPYFELASDRADRIRKYRRTVKETKPVDGWPDAPDEVFDEE